MNFSVLLHIVFLPDKTCQALEDLTTWRNAGGMGRRVVAEVGYGAAGLCMTVHAVAYASFAVSFYSIGVAISYARCLNRGWINRSSDKWLSLATLARKISFLSGVVALGIVEIVLFRNPFSQKVQLRDFESLLVD